MQLRYLKTALPPADTIQKVTSIAWAPNNAKLAAVTTDKVVYLFDENGDRKDKFKTKASDSAGSGAYVVRQMAFSPDSTKLAIAQSDNIVFVYRLGLDWADKKSICNKFLQSTAVTCLVWPKERPNEVVFGCADGQVKVGLLKSNKVGKIYAHPEGSYVVSLAPSLNGQAVVAGHLDGSIYKFTFPSDDGTVMGHQRIAQHPCIPYALGWGQAIAAAGNDSKVVLYDSNTGAEVQNMDYSQDENVREFSCCTFNPAGDTLVLGTFNRFYIFSLNTSRGVWEEVGMKHVDNYYTVTSVAWKPDGSKLGLGTLTGSVDLYDACVKRHRYKGKFEFTYVSKSAVIVKTLQTGMRIVLKSLYGYEIEKVNIYQDRFLIARTPTTLLMGDLETCKLSEVPWESDGTEKFHFENEKVCMVYYARELSIVEYGRNEILGVCRTEHMSPYLISVVVNEARGNVPESKRIAYLIDLQTARIVDLATNFTLATVGHDINIDWLELNSKGMYLLFRDKKRHLHLYDIQAQQRTTLLNYCQYVQWVPGADVVVAQSRNELCVWYNISAADTVTKLPVKGDVVNIERVQNRTEVVVDEGINTVNYALDEALIYFGAALEEHDFSRAAQVLEPLELTPETEAQWQQLAALAIENNQVVVAERCYAAVGDFAKSRFLHKVVKMAEKYERETGQDGFSSYAVRAQLAILGKKWPQAEDLLLAQGHVDQAIDMYKEAHKWEDAIRVAERSRHANVDTMKRAYYQWLLDTNQEEKAGAVKESEGDDLAAISLYLRGGLPARAAQVVIKHGGDVDPALLDTICTALKKAGLHERAGDVYEYLGRSSEAMQAYRKGHAFRKAVELARREFPAAVIEIEEEWGDWLMSAKQMDAAINHFIEAGHSTKAIEAAMQCRQFSKAAGIIEFLEPSKATPYYCRIAQHYASVSNYTEAENYFLKADMAMEAIEMYSKAGKWEAAQKVARGYLSDADMHQWYRRKAREFEAQHKHKESEKCFIQAEEYDLAINMYKKARLFDQMIRLVGQYRKDNLAQAHSMVAHHLEQEGNIKEAERHYTDAKDWKAAVQMYRAHEMWEDALRVAKVFGGINASKQVAYAWAVSLGGEEGGQLLKKLGLVEQAIDYAMESGAFAHAFEFTRSCMKQKLPEVHLKYAMYLEDEGRFTEAEQEFVNAGKPKEAIDMYIHNQDWDAAMRVAEQFDPSSVSDILIAQARFAAERKQHSVAESLFLKAKRPEMALDMYKGLKMWHDALRLAEDYLPSKVQAIHLELANNMSTASNSGSGVDAIITKAKALERGHDYAKAIETYLSITMESTSNLDTLEQCWEQAANLAVNYQRHRMHDVVNTVSERLVEIGRHEAAAELYEGIDDLQGAVKAYCAGELWDRARQVAGKNAGLVRIVEEGYTAHLVQNQNADELASRGNAAHAIDMYAAKGDWTKVHEVAAKSGPQVAAKYVTKHAALLVKQKDYKTAAAIIAQHCTVADVANMELYQKIAMEILCAPKDKQDQRAEQSLQIMMYKLLSSLESSPGTNKKALEQMRSLWWAAHLTACAARSKEAGLKELAARQLGARLRYVGIVPADKAFYEAGVAWREAGQANMAFVLLNRYLDLTEAMEEPEGSTMLENADFTSTDIPYDFHLPERHYVDEDTKEDIRDWVLAVSMDQQVEQTLTTRMCDHCGVDTYDGNMTCHSCKHRWEACMASGYPIVNGDKVTSGSGASSIVARRDDWNMWVGKFGTCPVTGDSASQIY